MKYAKFLILFFLSLSAHALTQLDALWTIDYQYELLFRCEQGEMALCQNICFDKAECRVTENFCHNCAGTDLYLRSLFLEMGGTYQSTGNKVSLEEFANFVKGGNFITINSKSIYNFVDSYDSLNIRMRFQTLCNFQDDYPLVFLEADAARFPGKVRYVICQSDTFDVYSMTSGSQILH